VKIKLYPIFIIEDELELAESLKAYLEMDEFQAFTFANFDEYIQSDYAAQSGVFIIDWNLSSSLTGLDLVKEIRRLDKYSTIYLMSAYQDKKYVLAALSEGADDYLVKPIEFDELKLKISNAISKQQLNSEKNIDKGIKFLDSAQSVMRDGSVVKLTSREYIIFKGLYEAGDSILNREQLLEYFESKDDMANRNIDVHIFALRKKIKPINININTVWGKGYRLQLLEEHS
jgi:DNA-binding response OmpR family regulator